MTRFVVIALALWAAPLAYAEEPLPRVLIIGDSISIGYTPPLAKMLDGKAFVVHNEGNAGPSSRGVANLEAWLGDRNWDVIHFNHGLHDLKYVDANAKNVKAKEDGDRQVSPGQYKENMKIITTRLKRTGATLIFATTTPVPKGVEGVFREPKDVKRYNKIARRIMKKHKVPINDLYGFIRPRLGDLQKRRNVHFTDEGSAALAEEVCKHILAALAD